MIPVIIRMKVFPEKRMELLQTRHALAPSKKDPLDRMVIQGDRVRGGGMRDPKDHPVATFLRMKILKIAIVTLAVILLVPVGSVRATSNNKTDHLFFIERSKNKNVVQYDVERMENNDLREPSPAVVYWVLEDGRQEGLTLIQRKYAYGIDSQEKLEKNKFRILLVVLKDREIIIQRIDGSYKAAVLIGGKYSILEKVFVNSKEGLIGVPKVLYIDLFGWDIQTHLSTRERIFPDPGGH